MKINPVADIFPLMNSSEFADLCADIRANGLLEAIWTYNDEIIDGRNRFNACREVGVAPHFREWNGTGSLVGFVVSLNLRRRHLNESQRAMVAARIANLENGQRASQFCEAVTQTSAAEMLNVSPRLVSSAKKVIEKGVSDLEEKVEAGELSVSRAAVIADAPKGKQKRLIKMGRNATKDLLNKTRQKALATIVRSDNPCLVCNPDLKATPETVSAFMQILAKKHPAFERFFNSVIDELEEEKLTLSTGEASRKILQAIDSGYQEERQIITVTNLDKTIFTHTIAYMLDYAMIAVESQGGKTDGARGARKQLYVRHPDFTFEEEEGMFLTQEEAMFI